MYDLIPTVWRHILHFKIFTSTNRFCFTLHAFTDMTLNFCSLSLILWNCGTLDHPPRPQPILDSKEFTYIVLAYKYNQDVIIIVIYYDGMYCAKLYTFCKTGTHSVDFKGIKIIFSSLT